MFYKLCNLFTLRRPTGLNVILNNRMFYCFSILICLLIFISSGSCKYDLVLLINTGGIYWKGTGLQNKVKKEKYSLSVVLHLVMTEYLPSY